MCSQAGAAAGRAGVPSGYGIAGGEEITVVMKDNLYEPATVTIKAGVEYTFTFADLLSVMRSLHF